MGRNGEILESGCLSGKISQDRKIQSKGHIEGAAKVLKTWYLFLLKKRDFEPDNFGLVSGKLQLL